MASYTGDKSDKVLKKDLIPTILLSNEKKIKIMLFACMNYER